MIAVYKDTFSKEFIVMPPESMVEHIISGSWQEDVLYLRSLNSAEYKAEKKRLMACTWSGTFREGTRTIESLEKYSNLVVLDIDKLDTSTIDILKQQLSSDPLVYFCFISPSGRGIKIVIRVNTGPEHHRAAFLHLQKTFEDKYLIKVDPSGKDVCRLCYVSWDDTAIVNMRSFTFEVDVRYGEIANTLTPTTVAGLKHQHDLESTFALAVRWVERTKTYVEGERNVYIHALACALNRLGAKMEDSIDFISVTYPTPDLKWHQSVRSAYFHNQAEHNTFTVRDMAVRDFVAPPFIANFNDDVAADDLMRTTAMLYTYKVPNNYIMDTVSKIARYYDTLGYIDMRKNDLRAMMNNAIEVLNNNIANNAVRNSLKYEPAEEMGRALVNMDLVKGLIPTYIPDIDRAMYGGMMPGNAYGLIGLGGTYKSIIAQNIAYQNALGDIPTLYLNGEMSSFQFYERLTLMSMGIDLRDEMYTKKLNHDNIEPFIEKLGGFLKGNMFVFTGSNFNHDNVLATVEHIRATTGKVIRLIIADGLSQFDSRNKEEIPATIHNSGVCKEIAKDTNTVVIPLIHLSGDAAAYTLRDTGEKVRGGIKTLANLDGYFSTSLLIDPATADLENKDEVIYYENKMYLRLKDKRTRAGVVPTIVNIGNMLNLTQEFVDPRSYEFNHKKKQSQYT
jgi:archaellum biogenesis ATPase FlaH